MQPPEIHSPAAADAEVAGTAPATPAEEAGDGGNWSTFRFLATLLLIAWALRSFIFAPFSIPSSSMLPTLYIGDYLVVAKWPYGYSRHSFPFGVPAFDGRIAGRLPARGDVAVFRHPVNNSDLIKRVIGLPGDTIAVSAGELILNGRKVPRILLRPVAVPISANSPCKVPVGGVAVVASSGGTQQCIYRGFRETLPGGPSYTTLDQIDGAIGDDFAPIRVPLGHVFMMGDNRDDSADSRFSTATGGVGFVPVENLIGRAAVTFWSTDGSASYVLPWTWFSALRGRIGNGYTDARQ